MEPHDPTLKVVIKEKKSKDTKVLEDHQFNAKGENFYSLTRKRMSPSIGTQM